MRSTEQGWRGKNQLDTVFIYKKECFFASIEDTLFCSGAPATELMNDGYYGCKWCCLLLLLLMWMFLFLFFGYLFFVFFLFLLRKDTRERSDGRNINIFLFCFIFPIVFLTRKKFVKQEFAEENEKSVSCVGRKVLVHFLGRSSEQYNEWAYYSVLYL